MKNLIDTNNDNVSIPEPIALSIDIVFRVTALAIIIALLNQHFASEAYRNFILAGTGMAGTIYLLLSIVLSHSRPGQEPKARTRLIFSHLDCLFMGMSLLAVPFSAFIYTSMLVIVAIRAVALGGANLLFGHLCTLLAGSGLIIAAIQPAITIHLKEEVNVITFLLIPAFLFFVVWRLHNRQKLLDKSLKEAKLSVIQLKLNNYKLAKYLSPSLRKAISSGKRVTLETQRKRVSVFFSDIKGFSELSEELETDTLTEMLNLYLTEMSDIALKFGGTVDKFIGDAIMVFFGDPVSKGAKEDAMACVTMAIAMQKRMIDLNKRWSAQGIKRPLHIRIGINTGFCTVGNFGTENRLDYTLLGTEVNKASRLESTADAGEILVSRQTYELIKDTIFCEPKGRVVLKGFKEPVECFAAIDLRSNLGKDEQCVGFATDGFNMFMDVDSIPHMQKQRVMTSIEEAYDKIRTDVELNTKSDIKIFK